MKNAAYHTHGRVSGVKLVLLKFEFGMKNSFATC